MVVTTDVASLTLEDIRDFTLPVDAAAHSEGLRSRIGSSPTEGDEIYWLGRYNNVVGRALVMRDSKSKSLHIRALAWGGEGSGRYFDAFKALLRKSTGYMRFRIVWKSGSATAYEVEDGVIR